MLPGGFMMKRNIAVLILLTGLVSLWGCGKKGPLVLEPEMIPGQVTNFKSKQVGASVRLLWDFPKKLADKKNDMDLGRIQRIEIYYSDKEIIPSRKFQKKATRLKKLTLADLTKLVDPNLEKYLQQLSAKQRKLREKYSYYVDIPFEIANLQARKHYFAMRYYYNKQKSPLSEIQLIQTETPIKPVADVRITREKKLLKLEWDKPTTNVSGGPVTTISGYKIYKKIISGKTGEPEVVTTDEGTQETVVMDDEEETIQEEGEKGFRKIAQVLNQYYEDRDTGTDGKYEYYITTIVTQKIESAPSQVFTVEITDVFPPDNPVNLVSFKASDHMLLNWKAVPDKDLSHYRVYRKTDPRGEYTLAADNVTTVRYKDTAVTKGVLYYYVVTAVDNKGNESEYSNEAKEEF